MTRLSVAAYNRLIAGSTTNQTARNTQNQAAGSEFQARLDTYHAELHLRGLATIYRTRPDIKQLDRGRAVIVGRGPVDYIAWLPNGRCVFFDAKRRAGDAFTMGRDAEHQLDWLRTMAGYGHAAGLLVWWADYGECRWHPIAGIDKRVRRPEGVAVRDVDWLPTVAG